MTDHSEVRRDAEELVNILARVANGFDLVPIPVADASDYANALRALVADLEQAERTIARFDSVIESLRERIKEPCAECGHIDWRENVVT